MKCEWVKDNVVLYVYHELADDARYEFEQHVFRCADCAAELKAVRSFHGMVSQVPADEPTPNLLTASRMRLQEALETTTQGGLVNRFTFDPFHWLRQIRFSPALAAAIFIVGFGGGIGATYQFLHNQNPNVVAGTQVDSAPPPVQASISGIRSVVQEPGSSQVTIKYDTVSTQETQGSLNDQRIQQLLLFAARNNVNAGVRMDSVDLLTQKPDDSRVREQLIFSLRYDSNPGVRLKAIDSLGPYVKDDVHVRDAILAALVNDSNQGVRTEALRLLGPVKADSSVRSIMQHLADADQNQYIRSQARTVIAQLPEID
jgi:HEAT repeat protein/putative zinc finger protein